MKLTKNHKIFLGLVVGAATAFLLNKRSKTTTGGTVAQRTPVSNGSTDSTEEPTTREGKIEYILANTDTTATDEQSGFSGDRFQYDPMLGYALPTGKVDVTNSGGEMTIGKEGNLANEVFFNADGEATDDPTVEADAIINELTDEEVDLAYKMVKAKKNNPNLTTTEVADKLGWGDGAKATWKEIIRARINDIKSLKKSPVWKAKWEARKQRFAKRINQKVANGASQESITQKIEQKGERLENRLENRLGMKNRNRASFQDEIINRKSGQMWGGHRSDGQSTNAGA